jgi:hypothetical protein
MRIEQLSDGITLYQGDCREALPLVQKAHVVLTDPPYGNSNHDGDWNAKLNAHRGLENKPIANDGADAMREVVDAMLKHAARLLPAEASACCCFCGGGGASPGLCLVGGADGSRRFGILSFAGVGQEKSRSGPTLSAAA